MIRMDCDNRWTMVHFLILVIALIRGGGAIEEMTMTVSPGNQVRDGAIVTITCRVDRSMTEYGFNLVRHQGLLTSTVARESFVTDDFGATLRYDMTIEPQDNIDIYTLTISGNPAQARWFVAGMRFEDSGRFECKLLGNHNSKQETVVVCPEVGHQSCDCMEEQGFSSPECMKISDSDGKNDAAITALAIIMVITIVYAVVVTYLLVRRGLCVKKPAAGAATSLPKQLEEEDYPSEITGEVNPSFRDDEPPARQVGRRAMANGGPTMSPPGPSMSPPGPSRSPPGVMPEYVQGENYPGYVMPAPPVQYGTRQPAVQPSTPGVRQGYAPRQSPGAVQQGYAVPSSEPERYSPDITEFDGSGAKPKVPSARQGHPVTPVNHHPVTPQPVTPTSPQPITTMGGSGALYPGNRIPPSTPNSYTDVMHPPATAPRLTDIPYWEQPHGGAHTDPTVRFHANQAQGAVKPRRIQFSGDPDSEGPYISQSDTAI